jgi:hypothetical protein
MGQSRPANTDFIPWAHVAARDDDTHHPCLANKTAIRRTLQHGGHEAPLESIELGAGVAKPRQADDDGGADVQFGVDGKSQEIDTLGGDVLAHVTRVHRKTLLTQLDKELAVNEVNLPQIGLRGVLSNTRAVLDRGAAVGVTTHAETGDELN